MKDLSRIKDLKVIDKLTSNEKAIICALIRRSNLNRLKKLFLFTSIANDLTISTSDKLELCKIVQNSSLIKKELKRIELKAKIRRLKAYSS